MWIANRPIDAVRAGDFPPPSGDKLPVCISLYEIQPVELPENRFHEILRIECEDLDFDSFRTLTEIRKKTGEPTPYEILGKLPKFFRTRHAVQIMKFAAIARAEKRDILAHCAAGISRSGAVTEKLLKEYPEYEDRGWMRHPNKWIRRQLDQVFAKERKR